MNTPVPGTVLRVRNYQPKTWCPEGTVYTPEEQKTRPPEANICKMGEGESPFWKAYVGATAHLRNIAADGLWDVEVEDPQAGYNPCPGVDPRRFEIVTLPPPPSLWRRIKLKIACWLAQ